MNDKRIWDVIVVGSGATGGTAALELTRRGLRVLVLEAGRAIERADYGTPLGNLAKQLGRHYLSRRQEVQKLHATYWTTNPDFFVDDVDEPFTTPSDRPFRWIRGRQVGGRTLVWDGVTPRFSDFEFQAAARDGVGPNWPIGHDDLDRHYAELERRFGVHGSKEGLSQLPDGDFLPARPLTAAEKTFRDVVERRFPGRRVLPSRGLRAGRRPERGEEHSRLSSQANSLDRARATGNLSLKSGSIVTRISFRGDGALASGVEYVDVTTGERRQAEARAIFLCASTIETVRLLLLSEDSRHPGGLGASSGVLGRYLMDHLANNTYFWLPNVPDDGGAEPLRGSDSILIPRYQNLNGENAAHLRGFGFWGGIQRMPIPNLLRKRRGIAFGFLCARSEALPDFENRVTLDRDKKDAWGIPVPHVDCTWRANDLTIANAAREASEEMILAAGGEIVSIGELAHMPIVGRFVGAMQKEWIRSTPGLFVHEVGGARMGSSPDDSVVNPFNQVWEAPNVFVTDGACWPSCGWQNPTLTEMAITARAAEFAVTEMREGRLG